MVKQLDAALSHFAEIAERDCGKQIRDQAGAGAAGVWVVACYYYQAYN